MHNMGAYMVISVPVKHLSAAKEKLPGTVLIRLQERGYIDILMIVFVDVQRTLVRDMFECLPEVSLGSNGSHLAADDGVEVKHSMQNVTNLSERSSIVLDMTAIPVSPISNFVGFAHVRDGEDVGVEVVHDCRSCIKS